MPYCWLNNAKYSPNKDGIVTGFFFPFFLNCASGEKKKGRWQKTVGASASLGRADSAAEPDATVSLHL